jgi:RIO kinase 1
VTCSASSRVGHSTSACTAKRLGFFGQFAPELLHTEFGAEIWDLYRRGVLSPETALSGCFEHKHGAVDVVGVLRVIDDARAEEAARLLCVG